MLTERTFSKNAICTIIKCTELTLSTCQFIPIDLNTLVNTQQKATTETTYGTHWTIYTESVEFAHIEQINMANSAQNKSSIDKK